MVLDITGAGPRGDGTRQDGSVSPFVWENREQVDNVFGYGTGGNYSLGMLWKIEGFFMINRFHMALINDNDFGLERV